MNKSKLILTALCCLCLFAVVQCERGKDQVAPASNIVNADRLFVLKASSQRWKMEMSWEAGSLSRKIRFANSNNELSQWFNVELNKRRSPFRFTEGAVDVTTMGAYQPGIAISVNDHDWSVTVRHENANFENPKSLVEYLHWECNKEMGVYALDKTGCMVTCRIQDDPNGRSLNLEVFSITVAGKKPAESLILPYETGTIVPPSVAEEF